MATLIHLADERDAAGIRRSGIKTAKYRSGVYCMPVLPDFYVTHQWLRELKRNGARTYVGVYFKIDSKTMVYAGRYNEAHRHITLGEAVGEIMRLPDPLGYELIIPRKILPGEITKIRHLPQHLGWRYMPGSHRTKPACVCPVCVPRGSIKGKKLRMRIDPPYPEPAYATLFQQLLDARTADQIANILFRIGCSGRRADPKKLEFLLARNSLLVNRWLAKTLGVFRHKNTRPMLLDLLKSEDGEMRGNAAASLLKRYGKEAAVELSGSKDRIIRETAAEWLEKKNGY